MTESDLPAPEDFTYDFGDPGTGAGASAAAAPTPTFEQQSRPLFTAQRTRTRVKRSASQAARPSAAAAAAAAATSRAFAPQETKRRTVFDESRPAAFAAAERFPEETSVSESAIAAMLAASRASDKTLEQFGEQEPARSVATPTPSGPAAIAGEYKNVERQTTASTARRGDQERQEALAFLTQKPTIDAADLQRLLNYQVNKMLETNNLTLDLAGQLDDIVKETLNGLAATPALAEQAIWLLGILPKMQEVSPRLFQAAEVRYARNQLARLMLLAGVSQHRIWTALDISLRFRTFV